MREASTLYQSHHYETYHFILSLSDTVRSEGLEHHQSSDNGLPEHGLSDESLAMLDADLLPHEFTHSWNGKYRRPIGLATPDYATPMRGDLLWVYEGMTQYWGNVLATRSGLWTPEQFREALALTAANLDQKPGRTWRNLEDTAIAAQILRGNTQNYSNWRRSQDYYPEGELVWLDADTTIRQLTHGQKSLNDFCVKFLARRRQHPAEGGALHLRRHRERSQLRSRLRLARLPDRAPHLARKPCAAGRHRAWRLQARLRRSAHEV